ncbi:hypothetical protein GCM10027194_25040 [Thalassiella azotivora]
MLALVLDRRLDVGSFQGPDPVGDLPEREVVQVGKRLTVHVSSSVVRAVRVRATRARGAGAGTRRPYPVGSAAHPPCPCAGQRVTVRVGPRRPSARPSGQASESRDGVRGATRRRPGAGTGGVVIEDGTGGCPRPALPPGR